jgi:hypothetical protein
VIDLRRHGRAPLDAPVEFTLKGKSGVLSGRAKDISLGGMFIETPYPLGHNAELVVSVTVPGQSAPFAIPAVVRWQSEGGMGVQFGLIGARETHAITEHTRAHAR